VSACLNRASILEYCLALGHPLIVDAASDESGLAGDGREIEM